MIFELAAKPAGGAALDQVAIATVGATVVTVLLLWLISGHRNGKVQHLTRAAEFAKRVSGLPAWAALPLGLAGGSLMVALLGMYWDIALHIGVGRDEGPLANPAHYLILGGLYGVFASGVLAIALPRKGERPGPAAVKLTSDWYAPVGGILIAACGAFALIGFPLDDVWHRLFGQDVTLWGPTHLMLIGGAGMTLVGQAVLASEALRSQGMGEADEAGRTKMPSAVVAVRRIGIVGGFLIGLSTFQAEFDFGVPQYAQVFQPFLIALAAGVALVAGRIWIGAGGAVLATVFFLVVRGLVDVITGPAVFDEPFPALPLYAGEALLVELAALALIRRPLAFGAVSGVLIGTGGFAAEYAWTQVAFKLPWQPDLLPEGVLYAVAGGVAGGIVGALLALGLRGRLPRPAVARTGMALAGLIVAICVALPLVTSSVPDNVRAAVELTDVTGPAGKREANATVRVTPAGAADDGSWLTITSWQGGGLHVDRLERVGEGVYRTTEPMPIHGDWKTLVRLHNGTDLTAAPIYLPEDPAIPAKEIPATAQFERPFVAEIDLLQRERKDDQPAWLWIGASAIVLALYIAFLGALAWGVGRLSRRWDDEVPPASSEPQRTERFERTPATRPLPAS
jgi:hypothetical protein